MRDINKKAMQKTKIRKHIVFSKPMVTLAQKKASGLGFNFAEYVRYLIAKDVETNIPLVSEETEERIAQVYADLEKGKGIKIKDKKALREYLLD